MENLASLLINGGGLLAFWSYLLLCSAAIGGSHIVWQSWAVSCILATVIAVGQFDLGLPLWALGITWAQVLGTGLILAVAAFKHADTHTPFNYTMLVAALVLVGVYVVTRNAELAIWLAIAADATGMLPTVRDAYRLDKQFALAPWLWDAGASGIGLAGTLMITTAPAQWGFAAYLLVINLAIVAARCIGIGWHRCHIAPRPHYQCCQRQPVTAS